MIVDDALHPHRQCFGNGASREGKASSIPKDGSVEVEHVRFSYDGQKDA